MTLFSRLYKTLVALLLIPLVAAGPVRAATMRSGPPAAICEPTLVPIGDHPGAVRLVAATLLASLECPEGACTLRSTHTYRLRNTASQGVYVQLGLLGGSATACRPDPDVPLLGADGAEQPFLGATEEHAGTWQVAMAPGATLSLSLSYERDVAGTGLFDWWWRSSALASWGEIDGARAELRLPGVATDDALLNVQPHSAGFDGRRLVWSYEQPAALPDHGVLMVSPPIVASMDALRAAGDGAGLADALLDLRTEARLRGRAQPAWDGEIAASLGAAIAADPHSLTARLGLAEFYSQRAEEDPDGRLNYILLALRELGEAQRLAPEDAEVLTALSRGYYRAALAASETGDPASALAYLRQAEELGGPALAPEFDRSEELFMRWALGLARQGRVQEAFAEVADRLSPETMDALLHYAPPVSAVRTAVELSPGERRVEYSLWPYPPVAATTIARLTAIAQALQGVGGCDVALEGGEAQVTLRLVLPYAALPELAEQNALLREALAMPTDLLAEIILAPLQGQVTDYGVSHRPFRDLLIYREQAPLAGVLAAWQGEAEYAGWRLVELNAATPAEPRARLEQQMALAALREQEAVWECVPMGAHVAYTLTPLHDGATPDASWRVAWGEDREIVLVHSTWRWPRILAAAGLLLAIGVLLLAGGRRGRHRAR